MKTLYSVIALLTFSLVGAQENALDQFMEDLKRSKALTLAYVEAMPADQFNYKPQDSVKSFSEQVLHMAQATVGLAANGSGEAPLYSERNLEKETALHNKEDVTKIITESYDFAIAAAESLTEESSQEMVERGSFKSSRIGWIRKAEEHNVHHRGSLAIYLRMLNITPPGYQLF